MVLLGVARWTIGRSDSGKHRRVVLHTVSGIVARSEIARPVLLCGAVLLLLAAAFVAAWIPAYRPMRIDPMVALRYE